MSPPIIIRTGAIALSGINLITGIKKKDSKNSIPVTTAVNPVFPPVAIPAALSTVATVGLVPNKPHAMTERDVVRMARSNDSDLSAIRRWL
ncbi:hypothetical protein D1872_245600 [compost metagenome]